MSEPSQATPRRRFWVPGLLFEWGGGRTAHIEWTPFEQVALGFVLFVIWRAL